VIIDILKMAAISFIWILMIGVNTRLVAHREDFTLPSIWAFIMSLVWVVVIREVINAQDSWSLAGFPFGAAVATGLVTKFVPKGRKWHRRRRCSDEEE
jgi:hypothetical protein